MREHTGRRRFLTGIGAIGATVGLAGCFGLGGPDVDLEYGDQIEDEITEGSPEDPIYDGLAEDHTFQGSDGDDVEIEMMSRDFDTYILLTEGDDEFVAEDNDGGPTFNSNLQTKLPGDGVYTIWAGSFSGEATGEYELELDED